jgi:hypothetical protein
MSGALNIFKTVTANITTTPTSVYSVPIGYSTVVLMAQITNIGNSTINISANLVRAGNAGPTTSLISGAQIPTNDAISVLTGRLIMNYTDNFQVSASANNSSQLTLSVLETLTG